MRFVLLIESHDTKAEILFSSGECTVKRREQRLRNNVCINYIFRNNIIMFHLNTPLLLKVKNSYLFRLAKVAIIRLNMKIIESKIYSCN
jgi:hypothetical protein